LNGARTIRVAVCLATLALLAAPARGEKLRVPPEAREGLRLLYSGETERAIERFRGLQQAQPAEPLGYLLEANALWWKFYCEACEIKWNVIDAWKRPKLPEDAQYFALADRGIQLAEAQLKQRETPAMRFYVGMGWALRARLHGLRDERTALARSGVRAREHLLRAIELDPAFDDAFTGVGLYNYYADALSPFVKFLRWFMGIPGGSKREGMRQLEIGMRGELTGVEAQFYLAKCLRNYDQEYHRALELMRPLVERFPQNPLFHLLLGDLYAKLGRNAPAAASFRAAQEVQVANPKCGARVRQVARAALKPVTSDE
jgi:tetratricopeptide (TPR) repeat protein